MRPRSVLMTAALVVVTAGTTPARPLDRDRAGVPPVDTGGLDRLVARWQQVGADAAGWMEALPGPTASLRVALEIRLRDAAVHTQDLMGALIPGWSADPDLTPLIASPVPGVESSGFGWRRDPFQRRRKFHRGTDFRADRGTPVHVAGDGVVTFCGQKHGYGRVIYVDHGGGIETRYAHLHRAEVAVGDVVAASDRIGQVGATGRATGPHLHFEVRLDGRAVDPVAAMAVAEVQRTDPDAAHAAALALRAELQDQKIDRHDPPRRRPPRHGGPVRDRHQW